MLSQLYFGVLPRKVVIIILIIIIINKGLTLKMASAQVVETSVSNNCNGLSNMYGNHTLLTKQGVPTHKISFPCLSGGKNISLQNWSGGSQCYLLSF